MATEETNLTAESTETTGGEVAAETVSEEKEFDFENIFADTEAETEKAETETETKETETETQAETEEVKPQAETLTAKYNGKEFALDKAAIAKAAEGLGVKEDEVIAIIQKGLNYDNFKASLGTSNEYKALDILAENAGLKRADFIAETIRNGDKLLLEKEKKALEEKYPYLEEKDIADLAEKQMQFNRAARAEQARTEADAEGKKQQAVWVEFFKRYPDIKPEAISDEMYKRVQAGENPLSIQLEIENRQLKAEQEKLKTEMEAAKKNTHNAAKSTGSVKSAAAADGDDFLAGFLS